jgi:hypothetical protein
VSGNRYSQSTESDHSNAVVTAGMLLLALLGVITVFHEPIAAIFVPPSSSTEGPPPAPSDDHGSPAPPFSPR